MLIHALTRLILQITKHTEIIQTKISVYNVCLHLYRMLESTNQCRVTRNSAVATWGQKGAEFVGMNKKDITKDVKKLLE